jgi:hypothetical protein
MFIALPWDEDEIGGCLSAGRGFVHVSAEGNVEHAHSSLTQTLT